MITTADFKELAGHVDRVYDWLLSPITRIFVPRRVRLGISALVDRTVMQLLESSTEPLTVRPPLGADVVLLRDIDYLREYHDAAPGALGVVRAYSELGPSDTGVLVDFGNGQLVRCDLEELTLP